LLAQARIGFFNRKYALDLTRPWTVLASGIAMTPSLAWENYAAGEIDAAELARSPLPNAAYAPLEGGLGDASVLRALRDNLVEWLYRNSQVIIRENKQLAVVGGPTVSQVAFREQCAQAARERSRLEEQAVASRFNRRIEPLQERLKKAAQATAQEEADYNERRADEAMAHAKTVLTLFQKRSRSSSAARRRETQSAREQLDKARAKEAELRKQLEAAQIEQEAALADVRRRWAEIAASYAEIAVTPYKKDISVELFGIAWMPYHVVEAENQYLELPAFVVRSRSG
jgi:hypothetical protein